MDNIEYIGIQLCDYLKTIKEIKDCKIYGSIKENNVDKYSDIDLEIDVSGHDNSIFVSKLPEIIGRKYPVIWYDYAPSLMPEEYIISLAISEDNPFLIVDIKCVAYPHMNTFTKENDLINNKFTHIIKVFVANYKHNIREDDCRNDILRMYKRIFTEEKDTEDMLESVYNWLLENSEEKYIKYLQNIKK